VPISVEKITEFKAADLVDLCQATADAIRDGIGFNWQTPPSQDVMESYWKGVLVVPERILFGGRLDGTLAASIQLVKPGASRQTTAFSATITSHFVAPWARGHGLAKMLLEAAEAEAMRQSFSVITLSVRETQERAIKIYDECGYTRWGTLPAYEFVSGTMVGGHFYYKNLQPVQRQTVAA